MTLDQLQNYFVGQRFIIKCDSFKGTEVFELHITDINDRYITCNYVYVEHRDREKVIGNVKYEKWAIDDMIEDAYNCHNNFELLGWISIQPINQLPEELFTI